MKKIITTLSFAFLMAMGLVNSASAISLSGLGIGVSAAHGGFYGEGTENEESSEPGTDDTTEAGAFVANFGSVFVEYDLGPVRLGVDYIPNAIETPKNKNVQGSLTNTVMAEFENHTTAYAILPVPFLSYGDGGAYLKAGAIYVDIKSIETLETGGSYPDTDTTGFTAGFGWAQDAGNGISVRAEILAAQYEDIEVKNSVENPDRISADDIATVVKVDEMMAASARISIVKTF